MIPYMPANQEKEQRKTQVEVGPTQLSAGPRRSHRAGNRGNSGGWLGWLVELSFGSYQLEVIATKERFPCGAAAK